MFLSIKKCLSCNRMKRVACLSTIQSISADKSTSAQVIDIFNSTRSYNLEHQITGAFIFSDRFVLMIIEGESTRLGNIVFKFRNDPRLKDFSLIQNVDIESSEFTSWGVKVIQGGEEGHTRFYEKLNNIFRANINIKAQLDQARLDVFLKPVASHIKQTCLPQVSPAGSVLVENEVKFMSTIISLSGWPKPGKIRLCPELIKICARLVGKPKRFEDLLAEKLVSSESELVKHLNSLNSLGILRKHNPDGKPTLVGIRGGLSDFPKSSSSDRFGMVLRNFLSAAKR